VASFRNYSKVVPINDPNFTLQKGIYPAIIIGPKTLSTGILRDDCLFFNLNAKTKLIV